MPSNSIPSNWISRIVGYTNTRGNFQTVSPNLPQSIALFGEANDANQTGLDLTPTEVTTSQQVGQKYGYGSPLHIMARILLPSSNNGVSGIPVTIYPQLKAVSSAAKEYSITPTGTATANGTHYIKIAGRNGLDGQFYAVNIEIGDTVTTLCSKISDSINAVLGCPFTAFSEGDDAFLTAKWSGLTSNDLTVSVDTQGKALGFTYVVASEQNGAGTPSIASSLTFDNIWHTIVVNPYAGSTTVMDALEAYNGLPNDTNPTGRFRGDIFKPFIAITGSVDDDPSTITSARLDNCTIAIAPAPNSLGLPMEASANMTVLFANLSQNTPDLDVGGLTYPDMPTPTSAGTMQTAANRNTLVQMGTSTADVINGKYRVQDFVTTYAPIGENPPQYRYCRNLMLDFNVRFSYMLLEELYVIGAVIANDDDVVLSSKVIKPKTWKGKVSDLADQLVQRGLLVDSKFMKDGIVVNISTVNPDRLETFFPYKRSGVARIASTTAQAGFNFGTLS